MRAPAAFDVIDRRLGDLLERVQHSHHARRLRRIGQGQAIDPPDDGLWAKGDFEPRQGCAIDVLVDGAAALPRMHEAIAGAQSHVHIAGWHVTPDFGLQRGEQPSGLRDLLTGVARRADVRVLLWAGPPLPVFKPRRRDVRAVRNALTQGTAIRCALDSNERPMHCHHEKLVIVDDEVAFVGGIDLTSLGGDRYDDSEHRVREGNAWHDVAVRLRGPIVADVARHFAQRWKEVEGESLAPVAVVEPAGDVELQLVRTVPERVYEFAPDGHFGILESYRRALRSATRLVYLENQFLWAPELVSILVDKLRHPPSDDFRVVVLLPANPNNGADDTRGQVGVLAEADDGAGRFIASTVYARSGDRHGPLYVHAKVGIVDDRWLTVGSANLNSHSLFNDSEVNVVTCDPSLARAVRLGLWAEHLELSPDAIANDPARVVDELWIPTAREQARRLDADLPLTHRLVELPGASRRTARLLGPLQDLVVDG